MTVPAPSMFDLAGQTAVITGGAGVLGAEMGRALALAGANVALLDIGEQALETTRVRLAGEGLEVLTCVCDVLDRESVQRSCDVVLERFGRLDILINGAGGNHPKATTSPDLSFFDLPSEAVEKVFDLNFQGTLLPCQIYGAVFAEQKAGCVLNVSSMNAFTPLTRIPAYSAAKAAVSNFTQWLAVHMAQTYSPAIRVNAIAPGFLLTEQNRFLLTDPVDGGLTARGRTIVEHTPAGRFGEPEDILSTVLWLVAPGSRFVTGVVVPVDGGFSAFSGV